MTTTLRDPLLGLVLDGRYRVDAVVARGGMAMVYRGVDLRLDREIAVKVMHAHLTQDPAMVERFHREALNAAKLSHPNLVSVNDQGQDGDVVYLVMEYLPSVTLRKELKHRGRLTPRQAIVVMDAVLAGLEVVHEAGIIHRDLKPDNVLLGADGRIKLADFGLARGMSNSTTTKTLIGTVGYVAPELVTRTGADARTDLYTLGIMFYEMLTGSQPYTDEVPIQVAYRHVHDTVPAPSERLPGLSPLLDALVLWTTSRAPEDRPQSARALREALLEARNNLTDDELDFSPDGVAVPAAHGAPVLSATIALDTEPSGPVKERKSRTDEIPYLEDDEDDPEDTTSAEAPRATDSSSGTSSGTSSDSASETADVPTAPAKTAAASVGSTGDREDADSGDGGGNGTGVTRLQGASTAAVASGAGTGDEAPADAAHGRRRKRILAGVLAVAAVATLVISLSLISIDRSTTVPQVTSGQEQADVESAVSSAGLEYTVSEVFDAGVPAGAVVGVDPGSGTELAKGDSVTITVSKGEELFAVPDLVGATEATARTSLADSSMELGEVSREYSDEVPAGEVISQSVEAGSEHARGTAVDLVVSDGVEPLVLPIVTGLDYESAWPKLARMGLRVAREDVPSDDMPAGKVVSQTPQAESEVAVDDLVTLRVSTGPEAAPADAAADEAGDEPADPADSPTPEG